MSDRAIAVSGLGLGAIHRLVHRQPAAGCLRELSMMRSAIARDIADDRRNRDGSGIHHRIIRAVGARSK